MSSSYSSLDWICDNGPISLCIDLFLCILCVFCFLLHMCCIIVSAVGWNCWDRSLILRTYLPLVSSFSTYRKPFCVRTVHMFEVNLEAFSPETLLLTSVNWKVALLNRVLHKDLGLSYKSVYVAS